MGLTIGKTEIKESGKRTVSFTHNPPPSTSVYLIENGVATHRFENGAWVKL
jgi:hypothetical protein